MKRSNFALRLQPTLIEEAKKVAKASALSLGGIVNAISPPRLDPLAKRAGTTGFDRFPRIE